MRTTPYRWEKRNAGRGAHAKALKEWRLKTGLSKATAARFHHAVCAAKKAGVPTPEWQAAIVKEAACQDEKASI